MGDLELDLTIRKREVIDYIVLLDDRFRNWQAVSRKDGKPVPDELSGKYTELDLFKAAAEQYEAKAKVTSNG